MESLIPALWNEHLGPAVPWNLAYPIVERETRAVLKHDPRAGEGLTTTELVEILYPEKLAKGDGITARKRIFKALAALATRSLADCASRGEPRRLKHLHRTVKPWIWHLPGALNSEATVAKCPHCGGFV